MVIKNNERKIRNLHCDYKESHCNKLLNKKSTKFIMFFSKLQHCFAFNLDMTHPQLLS